MSIEITCPRCKQRYSAPDRAAGRVIRCAKCKAAIQVPEVLTEIDVVAPPESPEQLEILGPAAPEADLEILDAPRPEAGLEILPSPPQPVYPAPILGPAPVAGNAFPQPAPLTLLAQPQGTPAGKPGGASWILWAAVAAGGLVVVALIAGVIAMATRPNKNIASPANAPSVPSAAPITPPPPSTVPPSAATIPPTGPGPSSSSAGPSIGPAAPSPVQASGRSPRPRVSIPDEPDLRVATPKVWAFQPDPGPAPKPIESDKEISIPVGPTAEAEVVFSPRPSRFVAIGGNRNSDDYWQVWDLAAMKSGQKITGETTEKGCTALSPDGRYLAVHGGRFPESAILMWSAKTAERVARLDLERMMRVQAIDFAGDDRMIALCGFGNWEAYVFSVSDQRRERKFKVSDWPCTANQIAVTPGGKYLAVASRELKVFDLATGAAVVDVTIPTVARAGIGSVQAVAFASDGRHLAYVSDGQQSWTVSCWDLAGQSRPSLRVIDATWSERLRSAESGCPAPRLEWLPGDHGWLAFGSIVLDRQTGQGVWHFPRPAGQKCPQRLLDGKRLLTVAGGGKSRVLQSLDVPEEKLQAAVEMASSGGDPSDVQIGEAAAADRSGTKSSSLAGQSPAWSVQADPAAKPKQDYRGGAVSVAGEIKQVCFSRPDAGMAAVGVSRHDAANRPAFPMPGKTEAAGAGAAWLERFDLYSGKQAGRITLPVPGDLLDLSPNGRLALVRSGGQRLDVYSFDDGKRSCGWRPWEAPRGDKDPPRVSAWFVDDEHVVSLSGRGPSELVLWETPKCRAIYSSTIAKESRGAMTPGRRYVAVLDAGRIALVEAMTGEVKGSLAIPPVVGRLAWEPGQASFSSDGARLAVTSDATGLAELLVWDLSSGRLLADAHAVASGDRVQWHGPQHLLLSRAADGYLVDLDRMAVIWRYHFTGGGPVGQPPDEGQWENVSLGPGQPSYLGVHALIDDQIIRTAEAQVPKVSGSLWGPGSQISIDSSALNVSSGDLRAKVEAAAQRSVQSSGLAVAAGKPVRLQLSCAMTQSETVEYEFFSRGRQRVAIQVPQAEVGAVLTDGTNTFWDHRTTISGGTGGFMVSVPGNEDPKTYLQNQVYANQTAAMEQFFGSLRLPRAGYPKVRDSLGLLGLGSTEVALAQAFDIKVDPSLASSAPRGPGEDAEDAGPDNMPGDVPFPGGRPGQSPFTRRRLRDGDKPVIDKGFERAARQYTAKTLAAVIAADDAAVVERVRWFPIGKRPVFGLRWGIGVQSAASDPSERVRDAYDLDRITGPVGPAIGGAVQGHVSASEFGKWPPGDDARLRQVPILGLGKQEDLLAAAKRLAIDIVVALNIQPRASAGGKRVENVVRARFVSVASGKALWASEPLPIGQLMGRRGGAPSDRAMEQVLKRIETDFCLKDVPELSDEDVKGRLAALGLPDQQPEDPLAALVELRFYQAKQLLSAQQAAPLYDAVLGKGKGTAFANGDSDQRRKMVEEWFESREDAPKGKAKAKKATAE